MSASTIYIKREIIEEEIDFLLNDVEEIKEAHLKHNDVENVLKVIKREERIRAL